MVNFPLKDRWFLIRGFATCNHFLVLKDKSGVGIIVDYSRYYTVVNGV